MVTAPTLKEMKERLCTLEELQAALVKMVEAHNRQGELMNKVISRKQDKQWRATI